MTLLDLKKVMKLLGARGASEGLKASDLSIDQIVEFAQKTHAKFDKSYSREKLIEAVVEELSRPGLKPLEELSRMSFDQLLKYFDSIRVSNEDLLQLMKDLNYKVGAEDKKHLRKYVARQISETALFSRVASREGREGR